eukprot:1033875-Rhodomonas_salina.10
MSGTAICHASLLFSYAHAVQCPVLRHAILRTRCSVSSTEMRSPSHTLCAVQYWHTLCLAAIILRSRCVMSGTETAYAATSVVGVYRLVCFR